MPNSEYYNSELPLYVCVCILLLDRVHMYVVCVSVLEKMQKQQPCVFRLLGHKASLLASLQLLLKLKSDAEVNLKAATWSARSAAPERERVLHTSSNHQANLENVLNSSPASTSFFSRARAPQSKLWHLSRISVSLLSLSARSLQALLSFVAELIVNL